MYNHSKRKIMQDKIGFNNFKAFGSKMQYFSNKPITLVYGANSAGKSSLLHAQLYLKHNLLYNGHDFKQSLFAGDELSLNGFENIIHKHTIENSINYELPVDNLNEMVDILSETEIKTEFLKDITSIVFKISLNKQNKFINVNIECIVNDETLFILAQKNIEIKLEKDNIVLDVATLNNDKDIKLAKAVIIYFLLTSLEEKKSYQYIGPMREYPKRDDLKFSATTTNYIKFGKIMSDFTNRMPQDQFGSSLKDTQKLSYKFLTTFTEGLFLRKLKQKIYRFLKYIYSNSPDRDTAPTNGTFRDGHLSSKRMWRDFFENNDIRTNVNKWLSNSKNNLHYLLDVDSNELIILDEISGIRVHPRDIGLGVSQVLPVLHASYGSRDSKIFIEQPELHLHPRLQSELADVFIKSMHENTNKFMIETHSEHLLLRMMKRMKQTSEETIEDENLKLTPDDVCLLYVDNDGENTYILELELDVDGSLLDPWPGGFFEEGFQERFF